MSSYHLVMFNAAGMVDSVNVGSFVNDEAAKAAARDLDHDHLVEVTNNGVRVARVPPRLRATAGSVAY